MHSFLKAIGYNNLKSQADFDRLINYIEENADKKESCLLSDGRVLGEYSLFTSDNTGIKVFGEEDKQGIFHYISMIPYCRGRYNNEEEIVVIDKKVDSELYMGMCDDRFINISMIFFLQNPMDYLTFYREKTRLEDTHVMFSGLSSSGKIILPTLEHTFEMVKDPVAIEKSNNKIRNSSDNYQESYESYAIKEFAKYDNMNSRIKNEDLLSIVDTSFVPLGTESDVYSITGNILKVDIERNIYTNEEMYYLAVECNNVLIDVCINKQDLLGEPEIGRRFRGMLWLQGEIEAIEDTE